MNARKIPEEGCEKKKRPEGQESLVAEQTRCQVPRVARVFS
jgi:hypothetical protein